jgi:hypothetical protein
MCRADNGADEVALLYRRTRGIGERTKKGLLRSEAFERENSKAVNHSERGGY